MFSAYCLWLLWHPPIYRMSIRAGERVLCEWWSDRPQLPCTGIIDPGEKVTVHADPQACWRKP
jgi:hypothetical protein